MRLSPRRARTAARSAFPVMLAAAAIALGVAGPAAAEVPAVTPAPAEPGALATSATPATAATENAPAGDGSGRKIG